MLVLQCLSASRASGRTLFSTARLLSAVSSKSLVRRSEQRVQEVLQALKSHQVPSERSLVALTANDLKELRRQWMPGTNVFEQLKSGLLLFSLTPFSSGMRDCYRHGCVQRGELLKPERSRNRSQRMSSSLTSNWKSLVRRRHVSLFHMKPCSIAVWPNTEAHVLCCHYR